VRFSLADDAGLFFYLNSKRLFVFDNYFKPLILKKENQFINHLVCLYKDAPIITNAGIKKAKPKTLYVIAHKSDDTTIIIYTTPSLALTPLT